MCPFVKIRGSIIFISFLLFFCGDWQFLKVFKSHRRLYFVLCFLVLGRKFCFLFYLATGHRKPQRREKAGSGNMFFVTFFLDPQPLVFLVVVIRSFCPTKVVQSFCFAGWQ